MAIDFAHSADLVGECVRVLSSRRIAGRCSKDMLLEYEAPLLCCQYGGGVCVGRGVTEPLGLESWESGPSESEVVV